MTANDQSQAPVFFVDNTGSSTVDSFMRNEVAGARKALVCVGYVSEMGLERLADWLDLMDPDGELLLLVGMAPRNWKFLARTDNAHAKYLLSSMQTKAAKLDRLLLERLAAHQRAGRLQVCLREPRHQIHAKLYLIQSASNAWKGLAGSSNLSESGLTHPGEFNHMLDATAAAQASRWMSRQWGAPPSQRAAGVWQELLNMATQAPEAGSRDQPAGPEPRAVQSQRRPGRQTRQSGCLKLVLGLPLASGLMLLLMSLSG